LPLPIDSARSCASACGEGGESKADACSGRKPEAPRQPRSERAQAVTRQSPCVHATAAPQTYLARPLDTGSRSFALQARKERINCLCESDSETTSCAATAARAHDWNTRRAAQILREISRRPAHPAVTTAAPSCVRGLQGEPRGKGEARGRERCIVCAVWAAQSQRNTKRKPPPPSHRPLKLAGLYAPTQASQRRPPCQT
jgi:hypothetical protein